MITPWGNSDYKFDIEDGLSWVSTPSHGGFMASVKWAEKNLTQEARDEGEKFGLFYAFEEDCAYAVVVCEAPRPSMEKLYLDVPLSKLVENARHTIANWFPIYAIKRNLEYNRERAEELANAPWYFPHQIELIKLLALTA